MKASDFLGTSMAPEADQMFDLASSLTSIFSRNTDTSSVHGTDDGSMHAHQQACTGALDASSQLYSLSVDSNTSSVASLTGLLLTVVTLSLS